MAFTTVGMEKLIEKAKAEMDAKILALADEYRAKVLIPLCSKHRLIYLCGNGTFAFYPKDYDDRMRRDSNSGNSVGDEYSAKAARKSFLIPVLNKLNIEISYNNFFGFYVSDVTEKDWTDKESGSRESGYP